MRVKLVSLLTSVAFWTGPFQGSGCNRNKSLMIRGNERLTHGLLDSVAAFLLVGIHFYSWN
jgi:hypothetical protein